MTIYDADPTSRLNIIPGEVHPYDELPPHETMMIPQGNETQALPGGTSHYRSVWSEDTGRMSNTRLLVTTLCVLAGAIVLAVGWFYHTFG